jgi:hypothetical protein
MHQTAYPPRSTFVGMGFIDEEIASVRAEVTYQRKSIDALLSITKPEAEFPSIEKIFQKAIGPIQEITGVRTVTARIYDPDRNCFRLMAQSGDA